MEIKQQWLTLDDWVSLLKNSQKDSHWAAKQHLKEIEWKEGIQMFLCFNIKLPFSFSFLILYQSSAHLQDKLLTKLLDQFMELHNTKFFQRLEN